MADEFDFDQFLPANETGEEFDFDQFLPESERPGIVQRGLKWGKRQLRGLSGVTPEQETTEGRVEPPPVATDPMGDSAGQAIMRSAPTPEATPERVRDSSVFQEQPRDEGLGNVGDPLRDVGLGAANAMGDFYDPAGGNVVAGQLASKLMVPFTMAGAKGMSGSVGEAARGLNVMSELLTDGEIKLEWAKNLADWTEGQAKLVRGEINNIGDIRGVADFGTYLMERFGEGFGGFAPFLLGGVGVGVGIGAVQGIGATYNALMEDQGIQDKLKSGELTPQDVRKISLIGGAVNGLATGLMVKYIGDPGKFTKNFTRDLARLAVADPAMFASGALVNAATTELLAGYFGGNEDLAHRAANVGNATVNAFFSGVPFGAAKVAGRVERRNQALDRLQARTPSEVDPAAAAAVSKDSGVATTPDIDPTLNAAVNADVNARAKDIVARVKAQREAEEAAQKEARKAEDEKIKAGIEATKEQAAAPVDTGVTVPEAPQTLEVQYQDLTNKTRGIMLFPSKDGKPADTSVVGERPKGVFEVVHPEGTYWYRTGKGGTSKEKLNAARKDPDALAELLGYGPSKERVAETATPGEQPLAVVERTPEGTEVKAAATTPELVGETVKAVEAAKGAPDRTVTIEPETKVIAEREANSSTELPAALGDAGAAIADTMYMRMLERVNAGKGDDGGQPQPDLQMGVVIRRAAGRDLTIEEVKAIALRVDAIRKSGAKGPEFQKAMREAAGELQRQIVGEPAPAPQPETKVIADREEGTGKAPEKSEVTARQVIDRDGDKTRYFDIGQYEIRPYVYGSGIRFYLGSDYGGKNQVILMYKGKQYSFSTWDRRQGGYLLDQLDQTPLPKEFHQLVKDTVLAKINTDAEFLNGLKKAEREMYDNYEAHLKGVAARTPEGTLTQGAKELLASVDAGGVPSSITNNMRRIADENGVKILSTDKPMDVVQKLRDKAASAETPASKVIAEREAERAKNKAEFERQFSEEGRAESEAKEKQRLAEKQDELNRNFAEADGNNLVEGTYVDKDTGTEFTVIKGKNGSIIILQDTMPYGMVRGGKADQGAVSFASLVKQGAYVPKVEAPTAPAGAGPKTGPVVVRLKSRARKEAAPEQPNPETPPVTTEVTPEQKEPQGRILRSAEQEAALKKASEDAERGYRVTAEGDNRDFGVAPNTSDVNARKRFVTRAKAAVKAQGDAAPQYYKDADKATQGKPEKGRTPKNIQRSKTIDEAWQQEHQANLEVIERRKVAQEEAAKAAEAPEPEPDATYKPKRTYSEDTVKRVIDAALKKATDRERAELQALPPEKLRELAQIALDQRKSDFSRGQSDVNDQQNYVQLNEERAPSSQSDVVADIAIQNKINAAGDAKGDYGVSDISETLTRRAVDTGPENTASTASANTRVYGARGLGTANESRVVKTKDGKETTVEGQKAEQGRSLSAEEKARWEAENLARAIKEAEEAVVRAQKAKAEREEMLRAHGLLKGEPVSLFDIIVAELQSNRVDRAKLADRLNAMTDEKFKNWIMRSEKGEFLSAVRANAEFPISRMQTREFRRLLNEIYNEPIYPVREMSVREAFKENRGGTKNALLDFIERRILSLIGDMKVMVVDDETIRRANILDRRNTNIQGSYDPVKNHILLNENSYVPGTAEGRKLLVHEALHGVLANALRRNPKLRDQIDKLRKLVATELETNPELLLKYDNLDVRYGLKDPDEFISETWANDDFRDMLSDIKLSEAQMREIGLNPSQGWVRDGFRAIVDMVRQVLGSTPNTRTAIEQAIRFTDQAFEKREALGTGAAKSALTPNEMAYVQAKAPDRPVYLENFAARKTTEASVRRELESRGVDRETATELVNVLKEELGADFNFKNAKPFIDELASNFGSNEPPPPPPQAKIAAGAESIAQAMFVPTKTYKAPFKITLRFARVNELAQMADRVFGRDTNPLREISDTIQMQGREKERILKEFEPELIELSAASHKYKGKGFEDMVAIALDASRAQVHPDVPLTDPKNKHLGQEKMSGVWGKSQYPDLAARFKKLSDENPELAQIYGKVRDMLPKMLEARLEAVVSAVLRSTGIDDVAVARRFLEGKATPEDIATAGPIIVRHIKNAIDVARLNGPYFNFARRGDFVVHGRYKVEAPTNARKVSDDTFDFATRKEAEEWVQKQNLPTTLESVYIDPKTGKTEFVDADGKEVRVTAKDVEGEQRFRATVQTQYTEFVETLGQAKKRTAEMREEGLTMSDPEDRKAMTTSNWRDILPNQMRALMEMTDQRLEGSKLTSGQKNEIIGILNEFSITMLGPNRIQSSQLPRRNVAGMSTDFVRSTIEYMERSAGYMARTKYQDQMTKALKAMEERTKALSDLGTGNGTFARRIANEMEGRVIQSNAMEQPSRAGRIIDRLNALSYADKLLSLGYSITNLTQTMYTFAELGGDHGATISAFHITKAYNDVSAGRVLGRGGVETVKAAIGKDGNAPYIEQIKARLTPKEAELLDFLVERGVVDPDAGFDMAMIKRQRDGKDTLFAKSVAGMDKGIDYLSNVARALPRAVEAVNRTVAALAAYRLEMRRNGGDHEKAMMYAQDVVSNSQFNSSPTNVPPDFRNPWLRAPLQFKLFLQGSMHAVGRQVGRAIRNESPGDRIKGIRALAIYVAGYQAMAGVLGLPGVELVKLALLLANALNLSDFKPSDFEQMVRRYATEMLGKGGGELATRGLTRAIGIDTSNRLGFPTVTFGEPRGDTEDAAWAYIAKTAAGAPASYIIDVGKGFRAAMDGEWKKAAELTIPIKTISDYIKADRLSEEGKKSAAGRQTMTPYSTSEKVSRIIGFTPAREAEEFEERAAKQGAVAEYNKQRQKLISDWVGNPANRAKAMIAIEKFNRDKPSEAQIDMKDLRNSEKRRQTEEKRGTVVNGIRTNKRNKYLVEEIDVYNTRK